MIVSDPWIERLITDGEELQLHRVATDHPEVERPATVRKLADAFLEVATQDLGRAERVARAASWIADRIGDRTSLAIADKLAGHVAHLSGRHSESVELYRRATTAFESCHEPVEAARTLMSTAQPLIYLGRYPEADDVLGRARATFAAEDDRLGVARVDTNAGNVLHRQDRHREALDLYLGALRTFREDGDAQDVAVCLFMVAVTRIGLHEFDAAEDTYRELVEHCRRHGMDLVGAKADYNIAYLYFLKGEYGRAIQLYQQTRNRCEEIGETYHRALCDLDQAEIYLELNLSREARHLAHLAFVEFGTLEMAYESAKALVFMAIAESQMQRLSAGQELLARARSTFELEGNAIWQNLVDLHRAAILAEEGRLAEAEKLCRAAYAVFVAEGRPTQTVEAEIVLARILRRSDRSAASAEVAARALDRLHRLSAPALELQAEVAVGRAAEAAGDREEARQAYDRAREVLGRLKTHVRAEHVALGFHRDKARIHQSLLELTMAMGSGTDRALHAWRLMEEGAARRMADLLAFHVTTLQPARATHSPLVRRIRQLRERLNWYAHQINLEELRDVIASTERLAHMRDEAAEIEGKLLESLTQLETSDEALGWLYGGGCLEPEAIRNALPTAAALIQYFEAHGTLYVAVADRHTVRARALGSAAEVREEQRLLQFQLSKLQLGPGWGDALAGDLEMSSKVHLRRLFDRLVAPLVPWLEDIRELVVVPVGNLHRLPFHALWDGRRYVADRWRVSVAPSASVYSMCRGRPARGGDGRLALGVARSTPGWTPGDVQAIAAAEPDTVVRVGAEVTRNLLEDPPGRFRDLHLSVHGLERRSNPMFSALPLGDQPLMVFDLYQLDLAFDLAVLTGCGGGLGMVASGDEMVALTRGLLHAGIRTAVVPLWEAGESHTAFMMGALHRHLARGRSPGAALDAAMREQRARHPHPFFWAPFVLVGDLERAPTG